MCRYADIILPLPLPGCFTYSIPDTLAGEVKERVRVLVPFGSNKTYVGVVAELHDNKPQFDVKDIRLVLDNQPVLLPVQMKLWKWIAEYFMSPLGEVLNAAFPQGMKVTGTFKPKTETYVELAPKYRNEQAMHLALDMMERAQKQQKLFMEYLRMSHWDEMDNVCEVAKDELANAAHCTAGVMNALLERGFLRTYEKEVGRLNKGGEPDFKNIKPLNEAQATAYNRILLQMMGKNVVLLHGVTSSGKTEIYIHLIKRTLERGGQVLYLLPEIALTVQMRERLQRVFGNRLGIYHSKYSDNERVEIWRKQLSDNPYDIILGARSAVFLPYKKLQLVIVDEEHETSFKQQDPAPRYHARSAAIVLAQMCGAKTLLGTATPSAESYQNALTGKYGLVTLTQRYQDIQLPEIEVVNVADLQRRKMMSGMFSPQLLAAVRQALEKGEQAILFQNRRGFAPMVECKQCGWVPHCNQCDVSLTHHKSLGLLSCHYCGTTYRLPAACPNCGSTELRGRGYGTEKVEDQVMEAFPEARVARMDLDTTRTRTAYERLINDFSAGRTNILIGTQMVTKGLDFDHVSVVGILNADAMLNFPDFRAYEHAFMMMAQVSGRAGRKGRQGLVLLQTKSPQLPVIQQVVRNDYEAFYRDLLDERRAFRYPPFYHLVYVYLKHRNDAMVSAAAFDLSCRLRQWFGERVLGPDKPSIAKVKQMNIRKIVLKFENGLNMQLAKEYLRRAQGQLLQDQRYGSLLIYFDVDPL